MGHGRRISVVGLGYVGLPVAVALARAGSKVIGFDICEERIGELRAGIERTCEVDPGDLDTPNLIYTSDPEALRDADFHIVAVPTPVTDTHRPNLDFLLAASRTVGERLTPGDIVVYEFDRLSGRHRERLRANAGERVRTESRHRLHRRLLTGTDQSRRSGAPLRDHRQSRVGTGRPDAGDRRCGLWFRRQSRDLPCGEHRTAEAAKVIENTQRDLNIALMNELALIFARLGLDTQDVLEAASTKWNFLRFNPGLVGGHCIGVDPYYLTHRAEQVGYHPEVILAGRRINDDMGSWVARETIKRLMRKRIDGSGLAVSVLGITFKDNVPDHRNTRVVDIVSELLAFGIRVVVHDPLANPDKIHEEYGISLTALEALRPADAVILAVPHQDYRAQGWTLVKSCLKNGEGLVVDVRACLDRQTKPERIELLRL